MSQGRSPCPPVFGLSWACDLVFSAVGWSSCPGLGSLCDALTSLWILGVTLCGVWTFGSCAWPWVSFAKSLPPCPRLWWLLDVIRFACWPLRVHRQALPRAVFRFWTFGLPLPLASSVSLSVFGSSVSDLGSWFSVVALAVLQFAISLMTAFCCDLKFPEKKTKSAPTCHRCFLARAVLWLVHRKMHFSRRQLHFGFAYMCFDCTLGFPGEGPDGQTRKLFTLASQNIGSINTNHAWKGLNADVVCLQETRIGKNNDRQTSFLVAETGSHLFRGKLLPGLLQKNGKHRVAHGGTAIVAPKQLTIPFDPKQDITALYSKHYEANRRNACWIQVCRNVRVLVFSIYAVTGASSDLKAHEKNDQMLADLLEVCSEFGDIPIVLAGDLQCEPFQYPSTAHAINFLHWSDPLASVNEAGDVDRPLTYSNDGSFSGEGDRNSSIDALLLNRVAIAALRDIHVVEIDGLQHRPLGATFEWHTITQVGYVHVKTAPICRENIPRLGHKPEECQLSNHAEKLWEEDFKPHVSPRNSEHAWEQINHFGIQILLQHGGKWGDGPRERGKMPKFTQKVICPGQPPICTLACLQELAHRLRRPSSKPEDLHATRSLTRKTRSRVLEHEMLTAWDRYSWPSLQVVENNILRLKEAIGLEEHRTKMNRIALWKQKTKVSASGNKAYIFHHLKTKVSDDPPNLISDSSGNIIYQPSEAIHEINSQWGDVFAANILRNDPIDILRVIWPYISHEHHQQEDLDLEPCDLFCTIQKRKTW